DAGASRGFQYGHRAARVDALGVLGLGMHIVDVCYGREMCDRVTAVQRALERLAIGDRTEHRFDVAVGMPGRRAEVVDHRLVAACTQLVDYVRADKARSAGDENSQAPCVGF